MNRSIRQNSCPSWAFGWVAGMGLFLLLAGVARTSSKSAADFQGEYARDVRPLLQRYCLQCHSTKEKKGSLDLERFTSLDLVRKDLGPWQQLIEMLEAGEMPPKKKRQPADRERTLLVDWTRRFLDAEARARAGDPGHVPLRRLSNAEYDCTIRDLTGVDLRPTREFPADGAAGEGFTNAAEALSEISPTLLNKYLLAAKDLADHAVLLPTGLRFSPARTRRDWTDESTERLRRFYAVHAGGDGRLSYQPYLAALVRHRDALLAGTARPEDIAAKEKLSPKYLRALWQALTENTPSQPLDAIRARWQKATDTDVPALVNEIVQWQQALWKTARIGSYMRPEGKGYVVNTSRQVAADPAVAESVPLRLAVKPAPGQSEVVLYLAAPELVRGSEGNVVWQRPRLEAPDKPPLLLRDYADYGPQLEVDLPSVFTTTSKYLAAAVEAANDRKLSLDGLAKKHELDAALLKRWVELLAIEPVDKAHAPAMVPAVALTLLEDKAARLDSKLAINGWRKKQTDLPSLVTNASDQVENISGRVSGHGVAVHPTPAEFVAVAWKSPIAGKVYAAARVAHAHPACGNGVAWWLEHRRAGKARSLGEGALDLGKEVKLPARALDVEKEDQLVLAVDARDGNHVCDLTEISFTITEDARPGRRWDLAADVADNVLAGNPHADRHGNAGAWSFVRGPSKGSRPASFIPPGSVLDRWRTAASNPERKAETTRLARQVEVLLSGARPVQENAPDRLLYDKLVAIDSLLLAGVDLKRLARQRPSGDRYGLPKDRFGTQPGGKPVDEASLVAATNGVTQVRLPAALFVGREFVVEGRLDGPVGDRVVQCQVLTTPPAPQARWDGVGPVLASAQGAGYRRLVQGFAEFRRLFPLYLCFPPVVPTDEVVSLKMFHREDEPLMRLFLDEHQERRLDHLWAEHRFISRQPVAENNYLPQFIGFVTQDQPKEMVAFFEGQRPAFQKRADDFVREEQAAIPRQLDAVLDFATRAYRRPLVNSEREGLMALYKAIRARGVGHDEALRGALVRVLVSPEFLFRIEKAPAGREPARVNDWELATRLSYFLWSSVPDNELRDLASAGRLHDPDVLAAQAHRMLRDDRLRSLAIEFGTQWIHVRGFEELKEKNEKLFPTFEANLKKAIYEEAILFFQDLFQADRPVTQLLDADYTFLNETLAKHYGVPGVTGPQWRRVEGMRKYGRGGLLGLASVQTKQAGASRTSPVLRGNWVVETLLGEKLPRPPADVPRLPEEEGDGGLTMRQQMEKHARAASCSICHVRIDPFGFALEKYDPIGRLRDKDLAGLPVDARARLKDGTQFEGIGGLRDYLLTKKKDVIVRLFCRRLLGYALGRSVALSDQGLLDEMVAALDQNGGRVWAAIDVIVRSRQFRMVRGQDFSEER